MDSTPSLYITDFIIEVEKAIDKTYKEIESEMFNQSLYPAGRIIYFDAEDTHTNWLTQGMAKVLLASDLAYVEIHE